MRTRLFDYGPRMPDVTVVTGGGGALAAQVIAHLQSLGHRVAAVDLPHASPRLAKLEGVLALPFDANDSQAWNAPLALVQRELGPVTGAVLIAGGWQGGGPLHSRTEDGVWSAMLSANLESAHRALRALLPGMVERQAGSVVVIGSRAAVRPETSGGAAEYAATKAAVVALAQAAAAEVLEARVRINAVLPSIIDTPANRRSMPSADPARWVSASSLAKVIGFLLSEAAADISGAAVPVYGRC